MSGLAFREAALSFAGVVEQPHFERRAFKAKRIFASLAPDGTSANILLTRDEQEHLCALHPDALAPVPNKWGQRGWTVLQLTRTPDDLLPSLLAAAFRNGQ